MGSHSQLRQPPVHHMYTQYRYLTRGNDMEELTSVSLIYCLHFIGSDITDANLLMK
jgi:hypothetical protein